MSLCSCSVCGNRHDNGLPAGAYIIKNHAGFPIVVLPGDQVAYRPGVGIVLVYPDGREIYVG